MKAIRKVGFVINRTLAGAEEVAAQAAALLVAHGVAVDDAANEHDGADWTAADSLDMIFTFGGDGTILRAARQAAPLQVPILGVNMGRVGFLTEMGPPLIAERVPPLLAGEYWVEPRVMLYAELWRGGQQIHAFRALNDMVASRAALSRIVYCTLLVNDSRVTTYAADGVICATPTGSTAYSMAAGGPILHPELRNIVITPVAPYLTVVRSLVLAGDDHVELHLATDAEAFMTVDGQSHVRLGDGDAIRVTLAPEPCLFARVQPRGYWAASLTGRLRRTED